MENKSFKEKQSRFREELSETYYRTKNDIDVPSFSSRDMREKRYTAKKGTVNKAKNRRKLNWKGKLAIAAAVGTITVGAIYTTNDIKESQNPPITVEQALKSGKSLNDLGINESIKNKINEIQKKVQNKEITNSELIELAPQIEALQFEVIKGKLSDKLKVEYNNIKLKINEDPKNGISGVTIKTKSNAIDEKIYRNKEFLSNGLTMSDDIVDFIYDIGDIQKLEKKIESKDIDRNKIINTYKDKIKNINEFATGEMSVDKEGNIEFKKTRVKDLEKENSKSDEGFEPGDE